MTSSVPQNTPAGNSPTGATSAADALLILFEALAPDERREAFRRLSLAHARHEAGDETDTERMLRSLERVGEIAGRMPPKITDYREIAPQLVARGEDIVPFGILYRHFDRSWPRVEAACGLIEATTPKRIEARMLARRLGKVWRYTEHQLGDALEACSAYYAAKTGLPAGGRYAPLVSEFEHWRDRELELARARGDMDHHLPSASPYRRRYDDWENALVHFGFTPDQLAERLARIPEPVPPPVPERPTPDDLPIAELTDTIPDRLDRDRAAQVRDAYRALPARTRYVLTARLGLGDHPAQQLRQIAPVLDLDYTRVHQIERKAIATLQAACARPGRGGRADRVWITDVLRQLTS